MAEIPQTIIDQAAIAISAQLTGQGSCIKCQLTTALNQLRPYLTPEYQDLAASKTCC